LDFALFFLQGPRSDSYKNANAPNSHGGEKDKKGKKQKKPDMNELKKELVMVSNYFLISYTMMHFPI